jgi:hypothetical protein
MPLIDASYFTAEINIPNADKPEVSELIDTFIEKYEKRFLHELLGHGLYTDFIAGVAVKPVPDAIWTDLKNGTNYTYNQRTYNYPGIKNAIANYVYYWYMRNNATETTGIGEVVNKAENAVRVSPSIKMSRAWNEMVTDVWKLVSFLDTKATVYTGWTWYGDVTGGYWQNYNHARLKDIFYPINSFNL